MPVTLNLRARTVTATEKVPGPMAVTASHTVRYSTRIGALMAYLFIPHYVA